MKYRLEIKHYGVQQGLGVLVTLYEEDDEYETLLFVGLLDFGSKNTFATEYQLNEISETINDNGGIVDYILISHQDADHYNLFSAIGSHYLKKYKKYITVEKIVVGGGPALRSVINEFSEFIHYNFIFLQIKYSLAGVLYNNNNNNKIWDIWLPLEDNSAFCCQIIVANQGDSKNTKSCIALLSLINPEGQPVYSYLFTGDATNRTFPYISKFNFSDELKLMLIPHHGSLNTTKGDNFSELNELFLKYKPYRAVVSGDPSHKWEHPHNEVIAYFKDRVDNSSIERIIAYADGSLIHSESTFKRIRVTRTTPTENNGKTRKDRAVIYKNMSPIYRFWI